MIILQDSNDSLELVLSGAVATTELDYYAAWIDSTISDYTPEETNGITDGTTVVTVIEAPQKNNQFQTAKRTLKFLSVQNNDTQANTVLIQINSATNIRIVCQFTLQIGDRLEYTDTVGFRCTDSSGAIKGTGPTGAQGTQGPQGFQGTAGGAQGFQGLQGSQGLQGFQGIQGSQGVVGAQGHQGHQGIQGSQGTQGAGFQGAQGAQGTQGAGFQGAQGSQGSQGSVGVQGFQGFQGVTGSQGSQGHQGDVGQTGAQGSQGRQGFQGLQGAMGVQGFQGDVGSQGFQGDAGPQGFQGLQGSDGAQGFQGATGSQGSQGFQGLQGSVGSQGFQGHDGAQGAQGFQGLQGSSGAQGFQGSAGAQGSQGFQGVQGSAGSQGFQGLQGSQGSQGAQGSQGSQGSQGAQGLTSVAMVYSNTSVAAGDTIASTAAETTFTDPSYTIPANSLVAGSVIRVKIFGVYSTLGATTPTMTIKVKLGGTTYLTTGAVTMTGGLTNLGWMLDAQLTVFTAGASGTVDAQGFVDYSTAASTALVVNPSNTGTTVLDTTASKALTVTAQWSASSASNSITLRNVEVFIDNLSSAGTAGAFLAIANNLSDVANAATARANLGVLGYTLQVGTNPFNPLDSTTYYTGYPSARNAVTTGGLKKIWILKSGTITSISLNFYITGTLGSAETSTIYLRLNNTTDTSISSAVVCNATFSTFSNTGLSIAVSAGDYVEIKWDAPAFATNPISVEISGVIYVN